MNSIDTNLVDMVLMMTRRRGLSPTGHPVLSDIDDDDRQTDKSSRRE